MQLPRAVKIFTWKACINALSTKANLFRLKITKDPLCPLCGLIAKTTTWHIMWGCKAAKDVQSMRGRKIQKVKYRAWGFCGHWSLLWELEHNEVKFVAFVAWKLWLCRNVVVFGETFSHPSLLVANASDFLEAFCNADSCMKARVTVDRSYYLSQMTCPIEDSIKVNWDAIVGRHKMKMDIGVIIWDCKGEVLVTLFAPKDHIIDLGIAKAVVT